MKKIYIPRNKEAQNILVAGAPGTRKSSLLRSLAAQAMERRWPVIFTDLKREYVAEFYRPGIDFLFNIGDDRCFNWRLDLEFTNEVGARSLAAFLIPHEEGSSPFFQKNARNILTFLFSVRKLRTKEIITAISYPEKLEKLLAGSKYEHLMSAGGDIRNGIVGNLSYALDTLSLLPSDKGRVEFSAREWAGKRMARNGNIFLASSPNDFEAQKGLQALLLDLLFLNMQTFKGPGMFILDEVGVFPKIPGLEPALNIQRSSDNPIVLAFQNFSQLSDTYGRDKKRSMLSSPYTKLILRMDGEDAEEAAKLIAMPAEVERTRETKSAQWWKKDAHHNYSQDRAMVSPVTAGEVQCLPDGAGFLAQTGKITTVQLPYRGARGNEPELIERVWEPYEEPEAVAAEPAAYKRTYKKRAQITLPQ
jgi:type IV secretory pathway TraG/TraD family ATPase VirD4